VSGLLESTLADPTLRTAIAQRVSHADQGLLNGAMASIATLSNVFASPAFAEIYAQGLAIGIPGSPFYAAAGILFISGAMSTQYRPESGIVETQSNPMVEAPCLLPTGSIELEHVNQISSSEYDTDKRTFRA